MSSSSFSNTKRKRGGKKKGCSGYGIYGFLVFRERVSHFSLDLRAIRPSEFFGTRRKVVLRIEAYAWVPVLGVFDKLREVEVSSYLKLHFV